MMHGQQNVKHPVFRLYDHPELAAYCHCSREFSLPTHKISVFFVGSQYCIWNFG